MSSSVFGMPALGTHEGTDFMPGVHVCPMIDGGCPGPVRAPIDGGDPEAPPRSILPIVKRNEPPNSGGASSTPTTSTGNNTNSSSPEFNSLMNALNSMSAAGAPITPPLQDNNTPVTVPTQSSSKNASLAIILFIIAGALGYYYYRKHGGPSMHEAL